MSIVSRPQPSATKYCSHGASTSRSVFPGAYDATKIRKPSVLMRTLSRTDSQLELALDRPGEVELDVERHELEAVSSAW